MGYSDRPPDPLAARQHGEVYHVSGRQDLHDFLCHAVEESGARLLYASSANRAPVYLGVELPSEERLGMLVYPFRVNTKPVKNRPDDEVRGQLRYGGEASWTRDHHLGLDVAGVDITLIVGIDLSDGVFIGLDSLLWDPLPMGISFYAKREQVREAAATSWNVWEKINRPGKRRTQSRAVEGTETVIAFTPERLIDYAKLERQARALHLDTPLRYSAALALRDKPSETTSTRHVLEAEFDLTSAEILDLIGGRSRLAVAVRGGVAEHHLEKTLKADPYVHTCERLDLDAQPDFKVTMSDGQQVRIECKNASPKTYANGDYRVEVQKTRASKGDPASRFYEVGHFDLVAACLYSATGEWTFRFIRVDQLEQHSDFPGHLAALHHVDARWSETPFEALHRI